MMRHRAPTPAAGLGRSTPVRERGEACPSDALLLACRRGTLTRRKSRTIVDHLLGCDFCAGKLQAAGRIVADEERLLRDIDILVGQGKTRAIGQRASPPPRRGRRILGLALGAAAIVAIVLAVFPPFGSRSPGDREIVAAGRRTDEGAESGGPFRMRLAGGVPDPWRHAADGPESGFGQEGAPFEERGFSLRAPVDLALRWGLARALVGQIEFLPAAGRRPGAAFGLAIRSAAGAGAYFNPAR